MHAGPLRTCLAAGDRHTPTRRFATSLLQFPAHSGAHQVHERGPSTQGRWRPNQSNSAQGRTHGMDHPGTRRTDGDERHTLLRRSARQNMSEIRPSVRCIAPVVTPYQGRCSVNGRSESLRRSPQAFREQRKTRRRNLGRKGMPETETGDRSPCCKGSASLPPAQQRPLQRRSLAPGNPDKQSGRFSTESRKLDTGSLCNALTVNVRRPC